MSTTEFQITYDGEALQNHEMDIRDLAPALIALTDLLDQTNLIINGESVKIQVNVKGSFRTGSFNIDLNAIQSIKEFLANATILFSDPRVIAGATLLSILGLNAKDGINSLISLITWVRNRKIKEITKIGNNRVKIIIGEEEIEIDNSILTLYQDIKIRRSLEVLISQPLGRDGISTFQSKLKDTEEPRTITKQEAEYFRLPEVPDEVLSEQVIEKSLQILTLAFVDGNKWRFSDGLRVFFAEIKDELFLASVRQGTEKFGIDDILLVQMLERQLLASDGIKTEIVILKVLNHRSGVKQLQIPLSTDSQ